MKRVWEKLVAGHVLEEPVNAPYPQLPNVLRETRDFVQQHDPTLVIADSVTDFYIDSPKMEWEPDDFPNVAPVWHAFWIEGRVPEAVNMPDYGSEDWGALVTTVEIEHVQSVMNPNDPLLKHVAAFIKSSGATDARWLTMCHVFLTQRDRRSKLIELGTFMWVVSRTGRIIVMHAPHRGYLMAFPSPAIMLWFEAEHGIVGRNDVADALTSDVNWLFHTIWLTLSFAHCKNVSLKAIPPQPLSQKKRRQQRRGRKGRKPPPPMTYHVLEIRPMREVLEREGGSKTRGAKAAMHICRGHFKTFTEDKKLFGKHAGTYWWPQYVRGSKESGRIVKKDYEVKL